VPSAIARNLIESVIQQQAPQAAQRTSAVEQRLQRVLAAFAEERLGTQHFASLTGYGHGDQGRDLVDRVFARVLGAEAAAVRMQFVSGTHAITAALFGVLRPGDRLLSITGRPYDTLEEVIGLRGTGQGSLADFGIEYDEVPLTPDGGCGSGGAGSGAGCASARGLDSTQLWLQLAPVVVSEGDW
jgi:cystathionine beta-lyase family protein involved in aluminum resistance